MPPDEERVEILVGERRMLPGETFPTRREPEIIAGVSSHSVIDNVPLEAAANLEFYHRINWLDQLTYCGTAISKNPCDLHLLHEIIWEVKPKVILELGTWFGGSALWLAHQLDILGEGVVITIDNGSLQKYKKVDTSTAPKHQRPKHSRIRYIEGNTDNPTMVEWVRDYMKGKGPSLVIHDAGHDAPQVLTDLLNYADCVTPGSYFVVEDTNMNLVFVGAEDGPDKAIDAFLQIRTDFTQDRTREKFLVSFNFGGWLKRAAHGP